MKRVGFKREYLIKRESRETGRERERERESHERESHERERESRETGVERKVICRFCAAAPTACSVQCVVCSV